MVVAVAPPLNVTVAPPPPAVGLIVPDMLYVGWTGCVMVTVLPVAAMVRAVPCEDAAASLESEMEEEV